MDTARLERIESSFNAVKPKADELADTFYEILFANNPGVRSLFPEQMSDQKGKLMAAVAFVVANIRTPEALETPLKEMGTRHVDYGVKAEHYPIVRDTMLETLAKIAGPVWNDELNEDWTWALNTIATIMVSGAEEQGRAAA